MKASLLLYFPFSSRKFCGLNSQAFFQYSVFLCASSILVSSHVPAGRVTKSVRCMFSFSHSRCLYKTLLLSLGNTLITFGYVIVADLAVHVGNTWERKLSQVESSLHLSNGGVHIWQPVEGKKSLSKGREGIMNQWFGVQGSCPRKQDMWLQ